MAGIADLVAVLMNNGLSSSGNNRVDNTLSTQGLGQSGGLLDQILGKAGGNNANTNTNTSAGSDLLGSLIKGAASALGGSNQQQSSGGGSLVNSGIGALTDILFGGGSNSAPKGSSSGGGSSFGGGAMTILAALAYQAFKNMNKQPAGMQAAVSTSDIPLGLRAPESADEEQELEQTATLVLKGMINAAKADGQISNDEVQKIIGHVKEENVDDEAQRLILQEMQSPQDLDGLVNAIPNEAVAAQVYAASLFAIEVDTPAERQYLEDFVRQTGLDTGVAQQIRSTVGVGVG